MFELCWRLPPAATALVALAALPRLVATPLRAPSAFDFNAKGRDAVPSISTGRAF